MYIDIERIKKHLNIDEYFTDDDEYIESLAVVAEAAVQKDMDISFSKLMQDGELPEPIVHACLLFIGNMYNNRESANSKSMVEVPYAYKYLLDLYHNYKKCVQVG